MKRAKFLNFLILSILLVSVGAGCKKNPKNITHIPANQRAIGNNPNLGNPIRPGSDTGGAVNLGDASGRPLGDGESLLPEPIDGDQDRATFAQETVHFEYDRSAVKPSEMPKLERVATFLKNTPGVQLIIEGHCDERGTEEYNRSLGERRAISLREILIQRHSLESGRITTVSFGEDKPVSLEKTEEAYAANRRGEFVLLRPR